MIVDEVGGLDDLQRIRRVVTTVVNRSPEGDDTDLRDIGMDSLALIELTLALESEFDVAIPDDQLAYCHLGTVHQISEVLRRLRSARGVSSLDI